MRRVVKQLFKKATRMDLKTLSKTADEVLPNIRTSISPKNMMSLLKKFKKYNMKSSKKWPYNYEGVLFDAGTGQNIWYDVPITLESNVAELHKKVFNQENYDPTDRVKEISNQVSTKSGRW